ncbi:unnamed protein product [Rotaria magnacalcarata]|uniref:Uncharacterized protein n=1 Tax=Rotaria magnacalcarata TaxID=392030 RepID=A0A816V1M1_9BILA|nr:unnamed protein product [Rotaria magnacalcarata]CAF3909893.1 unnamed protein product [Rotaria magnacalcarata]
MTTIMKNFPLLTEIDEQNNSDNIDWNTNAFQTLLTSNLPTTTVFYYAIDVGFRRLESSLYETYWDATADSLNDLSEFLFNSSSINDIDPYLYEAKCQLLFYASIAIIKLNTIRRRSINEAKMSCAAVCLLLLEQSKSYETLSVKNQYSSCIHSMRCRYLKRIFIIGQWLSTVSKTQFNDIQSNHEQYIETMLDHLFAAVSLRNKINGFIDNCLLNNNNNSENDFPDNETTSSGFVFIRRFAKFNEKSIEKHSDLMHMGLVNTLNQLNKNPAQKLICCIWTLCCMIEADRVSLGVLNRCITREHFSVLPIDFEQKPLTIESLNERDIIVFLLLCAQQNVHLYGEDSTLHPYLLYSMSHLCTQNQKNWWQTATEKASSSEFVNHLATIRLDDENLNQHPPKLILLETAKILFKTAQIEYEQHANRSALLYEQYAIQYFQTAKANLNNHELTDISKSTHTKSFFFYPKKSMNETNENNKKLIEQLIEECKKLARQCDELKSLPVPEPPRTSSPTEEEEKEDDDEEKGLDISTILSPVHVEIEEKKSSNVDTTLFVTPPIINKSCDVSVQTHEPIASLPVPTMATVDEDPETSASSLPPFVDVIFSHMNTVNQWLNRYCTNNDGIQNDIITIRDHLEKLNRATSQMIFTNVKMFKSSSSEESEHGDSSQQ